MTRHDCEPWQIMESARGGTYCGACGQHFREDGTRSLNRGDLVTVRDPAYGPTPGKVVEVHPDGALYVEGPKIDQVRVFAWTIDAARVPEFVTARPD